MDKLRKKHCVGVSSLKACESTLTLVCPKSPIQSYLGQAQRESGKAIGFEGDFFKI